MGIIRTIQRNRNDKNENKSSNVTLSAMKNVITQENN